MGPLPEGQGTLARSEDGLQPVTSGQDGFDRTSTGASKGKVTMAKKDVQDAFKR